MTDLIPHTAFGAEDARRASLGALQLAENAGVALASLALRQGAAQPQPFGLTLPEPGTWTQGAAASAFWIGPDQWMIEADGRADHDFASDLAREVTGVSVTEQTDGWTVFEITSDQGATPIRALLAKLVNLDPDSLGAGKATRTGLHHMGVFVIRRADNRLAVLGMRSAAGSLWHALEQAARQLDIASRQAAP